MNKIVLGLLFTSSLIFAQSKFVTYSVEGKEYEGYYSSPSKNAPLVYMVHDWDGITDYEIKRTEMLNDLGYAVFAVDLFGKGVKPQTIEEKKALTGELYKNREKMRTLLDKGFNVAKELGANTANSLGMGYCFGGSAILEMARAGSNLKKFVPFHGGLSTPQGQNYSNVKGDIVVFHGSADKVVSMQEFANLTVELESAGIKHEMITYSGAPHAFTVFGSDRYHEAADKKSWERFQEVLAETLK